MDWARAEIPGVGIGLSPAGHIHTNVLTPLERPLTIGDVRVTFMTRSQVD